MRKGIGEEDAGARGSSPPAIAGTGSGVPSPGSDASSPAAALLISADAAPKRTEEDPYVVGWSPPPVRGDSRWRPSVPPRGGSGQRAPPPSPARCRNRGPSLSRGRPGRGPTPSSPWLGSSRAPPSPLFISGDEHIEYWVENASDVVEGQREHNKQG